METALTHLVGMQSQSPEPPFTGLWTRLSGFCTGDLDELVTGRRGVRTATLHLMTSRDAIALRPLLQPWVSQQVRTAYRARLAGADTDEIAAAAADLLSVGAPLTFAQIAKALAPRWPDVDPHALGAVARAELPPAMTDLTLLLHRPPTRRGQGFPPPACPAYVQQECRRAPAAASPQAAALPVLRELLHPGGEGGQHDVGPAALVVGDAHLDGRGPPEGREGRRAVGLAGDPVHPGQGVAGVRGRRQRLQAAAPRQGGVAPGSRRLAGGLEPLAPVEILGQGLHGLGAPRVVRQRSDLHVDGTSAPGEQQSRQQRQGRAATTGRGSSRPQAWTTVHVTVRVIPGTPWIFDITSGPSSSTLEDSTRTMTS